MSIRNESELECYLQEFQYGKKSRLAPLAQRIEHLTSNERVIGLNPIGSTNLSEGICLISYKGVGRRLSKTKSLLSITGPEITSDGICEIV